MQKAPSFPPRPLSSRKKSCSGGCRETLPGRPPPDRRSPGGMPKMPIRACSHYLRFVWGRAGGTIPLPPKASGACTAYLRYLLKLFLKFVLLSPWRDILQRRACRRDTSLFFFMPRLSGAGESLCAMTAWHSCNKARLGRGWGPRGKGNTFARQGLLTLILQIISIYKSIHRTRFACHRGGVTSCP